LPFGRNREYDFSKRRPTLKSHFLPSDNLKLQIGRGRQSFNLRVDISLRYTFLLLEKMQNDLSAVEEALIRVIDISANSSSAFTKTKMRFVGGLVKDI
jgi:hypothetical protein